MADERVQFNARVGKTYKQDVKVDAAVSGLTIDVIAEAILAKFYRENPNQESRKAIYQAHADAAKTPAPVAA